MKNFLIIFLLSLSALQNAFFNVGNQRFASEKPPIGKTRAQWYKENLKSTEKMLRDTILATLRITPEEFNESKMQAEQSVAQTEQDIKRRAQDIRGTWIKNDSARKIYKANGSLWQKFKHLFQEHSPFEITDQDLDRAKKTAKDFGYTGEIVTLNPEHIKEEAFEGLDTPMEEAIAYKSLITIRPNFFLYPDADQVFKLRHEMSHIQNGDIIFERAIKEYMKRFMNKNLSDWNYQALENKGVTLDDTDKAHALLEGVWGPFHEYRADLEAMLAMKGSKEYQKEIEYQQTKKDVPLYDGYPLDWDYASPYEKIAKVPYMQDFTEGLRNDAVSSGK
jgi:hypothetical protein